MFYDIKLAVFFAPNVASDRDQPDEFHRTSIRGGPPTGPSCQLWMPDARGRSAGLGHNFRRGNQCAREFVRAILGRKRASPSWIRGRAQLLLDGDHLTLLGKTKGHDYMTGFGPSRGQVRLAVI